MRIDPHAAVFTDSTVTWMYGRQTAGPVLLFGPAPEGSVGRYTAILNRALGLQASPFTAIFNRYSQRLRRRAPKLLNVPRLRARRREFNRAF